MHVGKLLARLNPATVRFDVGQGGIPETTAQDIAGALGMVPSSIGRELLCRVWWPDGATLTAAELIDRLTKLQLVEWNSREAAMLDANLAIASCKGGESLRRATGLYATAHARRWPRWITMSYGQVNIADGYAKVRRSVIEELCGASLCQHCLGKGHAVHLDGLLVECEPCSGTGHHEVSQRTRAESMGMKWATYRDTWMAVYDWTIVQCLDELRTATRVFRERMGMNG